MKLHAIAVSLLALALSQPSLADDTPAGKTTANDVSRKADETARAVKDYTVQQRDDAVRHAKAALDDVDARIRRLETKVDDDWSRMDEAARRKARATLDTLRKERNEAAEWYGGLEHGSAEAWDEVKSGFVKSYDSLKESIGKATKSS